MKLHPFVFYLLVVLTGCAPRISVMSFTDTPYTPTGSIEVFRTSLPITPYTEIAQLETSAHNTKAVSRLKEKAKEIGADAIILLGEAYRGTSYGYTSTRSIKKLIAIAVRYNQ